MCPLTANSGLTSDRLRALIATRDRLIRIRKDLEGQARGMLKTFGVKLGPIKPGRERAGFRDQVRAAVPDEPAFRVALEALLEAHQTVCCEYERMSSSKARCANGRETMS